MSDFKCLLKGFAWVVIGVGAGLALFFFLLFSAAIFQEDDHTSKFSHLVDPEVLIFLAVTLISGAASSNCRSCPWTKHRVKACDGRAQAVGSPDSAGVTQFTAPVCKVVQSPFMANGGADDQGIWNRTGWILARRA